MQIYAARQRKYSTSTTRLPSGRAWVRIAVLAMACVGLVATPAFAEDYILGPQDTLKVRVFEWRPTSGTAFEWVPLTGEFTISAAGNLSLPIVGTVPAAGKTLEQVADSIGERLQAQVGLQKRPNASVEVAEYRPFFVTGAVANPGKFNYSPGLTVVQALSMAGGLGPANGNLIDLQRDVLSDRGDVRTLEAERLGLLARQARTDAVVKDSAAVVFPADLTTRSDQPASARMMAEEKSLFEARKESMANEMDALSQAKVLTTNQIESLKAKAASLAKQIELANKDVGSVNKLVAQGLTLSARELGANQNLAQLESQNLDVSLALLKAQQDLARMDQDMANVRNRYRVDALTESGEVRDKLAANAEKIQTTRSQISNLEANAPAAAATIDENGGLSFMTIIDRAQDGVMRTIAVGDNDLVKPGDVVRVERSEKARALTTSN
ncbi:exopolysaccharide biosynthesis protein [Rhizobium sp. Root708]|uniref:polysaccharide biosynthesis/export family protein n=1 Tax=Rhizobium sp. Root708 TaxID=1736592 RepID=UPI0006FBE084|nr:exopolysaccharide biosynthesis protein [Rhizobium sp. Root708]